MLLHMLDSIPRRDKYDDDVITQQNGPRNRNIQKRKPRQKQSNQSRSHAQKPANRCQIKATGTKIRIPATSEQTMFCRSDWSEEISRLVK